MPIMFKTTSHLRDTDKHHHKSVCSIYPKWDLHFILVNDTLRPGFTNFKFYSAEQSSFFFFWKVGNRLRGCMSHNLQNKDINRIDQM